MTAAIRVLGSALLMFFALAAPAADEALWEQLRAGGLVVLMRHTLTTSGVGDPSEFRLDDCATQRNLSAEGREQARHIGAALKARGVRIGQVQTSAWCRAAETASLAFGRAEVWAELNSTFHDNASKVPQTQAVRQRIAQFRGPDNLFLIGHGSNILALTGIHPSMGGMVVVAPDGANGFRVVGRLEPDAVLVSRPDER
ncbi:MAG TPA: histidine phosphatase family protein [Burkholderiales bacterium]|nr:histidine phosphatase family protein [Burkholderiales bacterium]